MGLFRKKQPPSAGDARVLAALVQAGADLRNERNIRHYLYVDGPEQARAAESELAAEGYSVRTDQAASGPGWVVVAERRQVVDATTVAEARARFEQFGGDYDGWEAEVVEA